jgi:hypothetical protein
VALDAGAEGEKIRVQNLTSKAFLVAEVTGPGQVRVMPNGAAMLPTVAARYDSRLPQ